jgi:hypothetical protein
MRFGDGLVLSPLVDSLILVGIIEMLRVLRGPKWTQIIVPAFAMGLSHSFPWVPKGLIVAPAFGIEAAAYLYLRDISYRRVPAYLLIVSEHILYNLLPFVSELAYAIRHVRP